MNKSSGDLLPAHNKKKTYTSPTKADSVLKRQSEDKGRRPQDEGRCPQDEGHRLQDEGHHPQKTR